MKPSPTSLPKSKPEATSGFNVQDVLFVLFKHKWMILSLSLVGFGAAAFVFMSREPLYQSEAKLLVRYVLERGTVDTYHSDSNPGFAQSNTVIATEIEILTSADLALAAAEKIGVETLLPESEGKAPLSAAAGVILSEFNVGIGHSANVLRLVFSNKDPELAKTVLQQMMECYADKHLRVHRSTAAFDVVSQQAEEVKSRLLQTEEELKKMRTESGILSLADSTAALIAQRSNTHQELVNSKAELAECEAGLAAMEQILGLGTTEPVAVDPQESATASASAPPPEQIITEYRAVMELLSFLQKRALELQIKFKQGNRLLTLNQEQIAINEARRRALLERYPNLIEQTANLEGEPDNPRSELFSQKAKVAALQAKIRFFESNLEEINQQFGQEYAIGSKIEELERRRQMEDAEYRSLEANLKNAKADQLLDPSRMPNIEVLQNPSEPIKSYDEITNKIILGLAGGGMALGLGLAFLIELLFDRRVKRPLEIRTRLQLPLMLSIPFIRRRERGGFMLTQDSDAPRIGRDEDALIPRDGFDELALNPAPQSKLGHFILPYSETIRDRIIFNFEVNNLTHKPKLVAVTGLCEGAGTSTIAAGLAKSFSEISGVKVLLVDLSSFHPEDSPLFGELPRHSLNGALHLARNSKFRDSPQNLYYASANARRDETGLTTFSPVHLYELMPHLQASDYDYIIFDMPPIDQTSRTLTMAGLMDKVLLVLDAENTSRDGLLWGYSELVKGRADVSCIFNKTRSHVPSWLIGEN
jgi:uncharacterized protein involved in exopolysaccharide biosynthesis/Mrp family chromosome partitioning ATPase